ncbi:MAG: HNH endonuclease [Comamonadaceae bacterium CG_4_9_14_3_um_filter_60_33]|nr:MAG: HNH endonuclease [Comamonadaceae bacterium CG2_30_59_20]PIY28103.1 MAG: HNH endonuclease [Comamonadaceae bacterium CG_4_10_14_3_um_filter_60_42]PJB46204.1 MAG: HNH endonuclease [Comamonadaceae bacterium CG_4_9_14_3_um_filter_60_33]
MKKTTVLPATSKGARAKLRTHFLNNLGRVIESDELRSVSGNISEWARRIRELRTEEGYLILTNNDRADLKPGEYLLETKKPQPAFSRGISKETRAFVLDRNGFTCQMCGAVAGEPHPYDASRKTRLHIGHVIDKSMGGADDANNLKAICSVCNEGAANITLQRPDLNKLLVQVRRATAADQRELLKWLKTKFKD